MGLTNDIATRRETQVRLAAGLIVAVLYAAFCISQFIEVDQAQRTPVYVTVYSEPTSHNVYEQEFPQFVVCPWSLDGLARLDDLACSLRMPDGDKPVTSIQTSQHTLYSPSVGSITVDTCRDIDPSEMAQAVTDHTQHLRCTTSSPIDLAVYFVPFDNFSSVPQDNFAWTYAGRGVLTNLGIKEFVKSDSDNKVLSREYIVTRQFALNANSDNTTTFTVQFTDMRIENQHEVYTYSFWSMLGILGGAAMVFYGLYYMVAAAVFQALGIRASPTPDRAERLRLEEEQEERMRAQRAELGTGGPSYQTMSD